MRKAISIHTGDLPHTWQRMRGQRNKYKRADLRAWGERLATIAREEIELTGAAPGFYPYDGKLFIHIMIIVDDENELHGLGDPDNIEKAIFDALTGVVYVDDRIKYIRKHTTEVKVTTDPDMVGTHILIYLI
jgi:Holliday junction resolvase RusA-like endonuclease